MFKAFYILSLALLSLTASAQDNNTVATFSSTAAMLENDATNSWSTFSLQTSEEHLSYIQTELSKYEKAFSLEMTSTSPEGPYDCKLVFNHHIDIMYLHKIFKVMEVKSILVNGSTYTLDQLPTIPR